MILQQAHARFADADESANIESMKSTYQNAAILVIGNEVLSGRTREANAWLAAQKFFERGCHLSEIAIVADIQAEIVQTLNRLRQKYDAVITSGGIGPTHDDVTMDAVAQAFDVELLEHTETMEKLRSRFGDDINPGRRRMARLPQGAEPILCKESLMPGAAIGNVYVLAGVPYIFASQLETLLDQFGGTPFIREEVEVELPESCFAEHLSEIQGRFPEVEIGSYPGRCGNNPTGKICFSTKSPQQLASAKQEVSSMIAALHSSLN